MCWTKLMLQALFSCKSPLYIHICKVHNNNNNNNNNNNDNHQTSEFNSNR